MVAVGAASTSPSCIVSVMRLATFSSCFTSPAAGGCVFLAAAVALDFFLAFIFFLAFALAIFFLAAVAADVFLALTDLDVVVVAVAVVAAFAASSILTFLGLIRPWVSFSLLFSAHLSLRTSFCKNKEYCLHD